MNAKANKKKEVEDDVEVFVLDKGPAKVTTSIRMEKADLDQAKDLNINVSKTCRRAIKTAVKKRLSGEIKK